MAEAVTAEVTPLLQGLPDEIVVWEILVRLPPKYLLRCRAVRRAWRTVTSARNFLLTHHGRQPSLPIFSGDSPWILDGQYHNIFAFDHRAATDDSQLHAVARLDGVIRPEVSCDGLLVLSGVPSICNPATREHALLRLPYRLEIMGMYPHRPTGEYRLLLQRSRCEVTALVPKGQAGCYVFTLGSDQPPRYIGWPEMAPWIFTVPVWVRDSLHWYPVHSEWGGNKIKFVVFDTIAESFREMHQPIVSDSSCIFDSSYIFDMDGTLGFYTRYHYTQVVDIRVLQNYEGEVWDLRYRVKLPVAEITTKVGDSDNFRYLDVVSVDGGVLLLVTVSGWLFHVDSDGKLVNSFYCGRQGLRMSGCRLKQSLVQHTFFPALEGYAVNASPFIGPVE